jgi:apolipoprotein N-acyltransferase
MSNPTLNTGILRFRIHGVLAGLVLASCNLFPKLVPFQIMAFALIFYLPAKRRATRGSLLVMGLYLGLAYTVPQVIALRLPALMTLVLVLDLVAMSMLLCWASGRLLSGPPVLSALAVASWVTILDWLNYTLVPLWGTAQSFARSWSEYPDIVQLEWFAGMPATVFVTAALAALATRYVVSQPSREQNHIRLAAIVILVVVLVGGLPGRIHTQVATMRAAAIGWPLTNDSISPDNPVGFRVLVAEPVSKVAANGAKLAVLPEAAFAVSRQTRKQLFGQLGSLAADSKLFLVAGYIDLESDENRLAIFGPDGELCDIYSKTHTIFVMEQWQKGTGKMPTVDAGGVRLSGMICQDDNFTDLSRVASRSGVQVLALPTLDWPNVSDAHLHNSLHRPIESSYAIVRAAVNGISLITDCHGRVLTRRDHNKDGAGFVVADIPICAGESRSVYGTSGQLIMSIVCAVCLGLWAVKARHVQRAAESCV